MNQAKGWERNSKTDNTSNERKAFHHSSSFRNLDQTGEIEELNK